MIKDQIAGIFSPEAPVCSTSASDLKHDLINCQHFHLLCQSMPIPVVILNNNFQVVTANDLCLNLMNYNNLNKFMGTKLAFSSELKENSTKCHSIFVENFEVPLEGIQVDAKQMVAEEQKFFVVTLTDLSKQNRQRSMEQIFFHDILNTAGGMHGMAEVLLEAEPEEVSELQDSVHNLAAQLVDEITAQRDFVAAENGELRVKSQRLQSSILLKDLALTYRNHPASGQRDISIHEESGTLQFISDQVLLNRVLGNMIKNALEASVYPEKVILSSKLSEQVSEKPRQITFSVHNPGYIQEINQGKIFTHSFSTKGTGRGLGTFGMRMLAEKYLGGQVSFSSDPATGTIFSVTLPLGGP